MPDIIISEPMDGGSVNSLSRDFDVLYDPDLVNRPEELYGSLSDSRAIIVRNQTQVRIPLLDAAPNLKVVGRLGVGLDNIDMEECARRNIPVFPAIGANTDSVAELVIGALFVLFRNAYLASEHVLKGEWPRLTLNGREIQGQTLGLIGFGAIARAVATRAQAMGMKLCAFDPNISNDDPAWGQYGVEPMAFGDVLAAADAVSLHVPLVEETRHLINANAMEKLKDGAYVLNTSRGGVVDEQALVEALKSGKLAGAFLDVFEVEPVQAGSHLVNVPGLIVSPHIGALTAESDDRVGKMTADNVRRVLEQG